MAKPVRILSPRKRRVCESKKKKKKKSKRKKSKHTKRMADHKDLACDFCAIKFHDPCPIWLYTQQQQVKSGEANLAEEIVTCVWGRMKFGRPHGRQCYPCRRLHYFDGTYCNLTVAQMITHLQEAEYKKTFKAKRDKVIVALGRKGSQARLDPSDYETAETLTIYDRVGEEEYVEGTKMPWDEFTTRYPAGPNRPTNIKKTSG